MNLTPLEELLNLLELERTGTATFRGRCPANSSGGTVYGGQLTGQALAAAGRTVPEDRAAHSLPACFLRPGDRSLPVCYEAKSLGRHGVSWATGLHSAVSLDYAMWFHWLLRVDA